MARHGPDHMQIDGTSRPTKRLKTNNPGPVITADSSTQRQSPGDDGEANTDSYDSNSVRDRRRTRDNYRPQNSHFRSRRRTPPADQSESRDTGNQLRNRHSKKDRKENPSTRIHSLRRLLSRGSLPPVVHREKERELAALLFDQQKESIKNNAKRNLERYHFIRFLERKKATKALERLKKLQNKGDVSDDLAKQIHEAEVDLHYTQYAPLGQKYISLFARKDFKDEKPGSRLNNLSKMNKRDLAILDDEQKAQLDKESVEAAGTLDLTGDMEGIKPPMWYEVEKRMKQSQKALDDLRDDKGTSGATHREMVVGIGSKRKPEWLDDDGMIDPEDLDSESDSEDGGAAVDEDGESSDGDGGFFEKR